MELATRLLPEERRRPAPLLQRICSFRVKYRHLKLALIGLGIISGIWTLISLLEIRFLGFYFYW